VFRDFVAVRPSGNGIYFRAAADSRAENVTLYDSSSNSGLMADDTNGGLGGTCSTSLVCSTSGGSCSSNDDCGSGVCTRNPEGCSFTATNTLSVNNASYGLSATHHTFLIDFANAAGNGDNYGMSESIGDSSGSVRSSLSQMPSGVGLGSGQCILWIPPGSNMKGAGKGGADIGANILRRYEGGQLTAKPLWDPATGRFPCGRVIPGINDGQKRCENLHQRLNVNTNGCPFPPGYGS
jgi:hypothetical protein